MPDMVLIVGGILVLLICMFGVWRIRVRERRIREEAHRRKLEELKNG